MYFRVSHHTDIALPMCLFAPATQLLFATALSAQQATIKSAPVDTQLTYKVIPARAESHGYQIHRGSKVTIHQPSIPGMPGNSGFKDQAAASRIAGLVLSKIQQGEMPPTVTVAELCSENVVK